VPAAKPDTDWLPLAEVVLRPLPLTDTEVAFALNHVIVAVPGAVAVVGFVLIEALTDTAEVTVNVAACVTGPPLPCAVIV